MSYIQRNKGYIIVISLLVIIAIICYILFRVKQEKVITYVQENEDISFLKKYEVNQFVPVYVTDDQMANIYYHDYIQKMLYNKEEAYNILEKNFKKQNYSSISDYDQYVNSLLEKADGFTIKSFTVRVENENKIYSILDSNDIIYTFNVTAVMVYNVSFTSI